LTAYDAAMDAPSRLVLTLFLLVIAGCGGPSVLDLPADEATRPVLLTHTAVPLARATDGLRISLPPTSRPGGLPAPADFGAVAPFKKHESRDKADVYATPLPIHSNLLPTKMEGTHTFGSKPPPGLEVWLGEQRLEFKRRGRGKHAFGFSRSHLLVGVPEGSGTPDHTQLRMRFARATDAEVELSYSAAGRSAEDFVQRTITVGQHSHRGVFLPSPATASWSVMVPDSGRLSTRATVLTPPISSVIHSDGANVVVRVDGTDVATLPAEVGQFRQSSVDLSTWAGQQVTLELVSQPRASADFDYVFLEEPTIYTPSEDPRRILMIFVDTLRPDHLGFYGYDVHPTTPNLDRWAEGAAVFTDTRTVAPWTLPSARAALSGDQPEMWFETDNLPERLGDAGWHTEAIVTNAFLSQPFDMHRGWGHFEYIHLLETEGVVDRAQKLIERHSDRDLMMMVHVMEPHLPYEEPLLYQHMWAGSKPDQLEWVSRNHLVRVDGRHPQFAEIDRYVKARYDQNIRVVDDEILPLIEAVGANASVVLFSDHGEEFWEHDGFEHGHAFWDEVLRVPLAIRSPSMPAGRFDAPTSLLDLTPTVLELAGLPSEVAVGRSLVDLGFGAEGAADGFVERSQAFGRPLYGDDGWGVVADGHKWASRGGTQTLFRVQTDPGEHKDLAGACSLTKWPDELESALDRPVHRVWRLSLRGGAKKSMVLKLAHPDGVTDAWSAYDPRGRAASTVPSVVEGDMVLALEPGAALPAAVYIRPAGDALDVQGLVLSLAGEGVDKESPSRLATLIPGPKSAVVASLAAEGMSISVDLALAPERAGVEVSGFHPDMEAQLEALGYVDGH